MADHTRITGLRGRVQDALEKFILRVEHLCQDGLEEKSKMQPSTEKPLSSELTMPWLMFLVMASRLQAAAVNDVSGGPDDHLFNLEDCHLFLENLRQLKQLSELDPQSVYHTRGVDKESINYVFDKLVSELSQLAVATASLPHVASYPHEER